MIEESVVRHFCPSSRPRMPRELWSIPSSDPCSDADLETHCNPWRKKLIAAGNRLDVQAERVAAKIIADVAWRRGDAGLRSVHKSLDGTDLEAHRGLGLTAVDRRGAKSGNRFPRAVKHAISNVRKWLTHVAAKLVMDVDPGRERSDR